MLLLQTSLCRLILTTNKQVARRGGPHSCHQIRSINYFESDEDRLDRSFLHPRKDVHNAKELALFEYRSAENPP